MLRKEEKLTQLRKVTWEAIDKDADLEADLRAVYFFLFEIMMCDLVNGTTVTGCSFSQRGLNTLLVLKAVRDDIPQVVFVTEKFPMDCIRTLGRLWIEDRLKWHLDRFT